MSRKTILKYYLISAYIFTVIFVIAFSFGSISLFLETTIFIGNGIYLISYPIVGVLIAKFKTKGLQLKIWYSVLGLFWLILVIAFLIEITEFTLY